MLCDHCGTCIIFDKEDYVKMVFSDGTKKWWHHHPCFGLDFLDLKKVRKEHHEKDTPVSRPTAHFLAERGTPLPVQRGAITIKCLGIVSH